MAEVSHDVFVSYSEWVSKKSIAGVAGSGDEWPITFAGRLKTLLADLASRDSPSRPPDWPSVYTFGNREIGENFKEKIAGACNARVFLPILSETYFASIMCFYEWHAFTTNNPNFGQVTQFKANKNNRDRLIKPVWRLEDQSLDMEIESSMLKRAASVAQAIQDRNGIDAAAAEEWTKRWVQSLCAELNPLDLTPYGDVGPRGFDRNRTIHEQMSRLCEDIYSVLDEPGPSSSATVEAHWKLCVLSTTALGLDRFRTGGWGFSMGPEFERDERAKLLKQGRYELNLMVLRGLREFLDEENYAQEAVSSLLEELQRKAASNANLGVQDRKKRIAAFLTLLHSSDNAPLRTLLAERKGECVEALTHQPFLDRWVVDRPPRLDNFDNVVFFDFIARAQRDASALGAFGTLLDSTHVIADRKRQVEENLKSAEKALRDWLSNNDILKSLRNHFALIYERLTKDPKIHHLSDSEIGQYTRPTAAIEQTLLHLRMICSLQQSAVILGSSIPARRHISDIAALLPKIVACLKEQRGNQQMLREFLRVFPTYCLSAMDLAFHEPGIGVIPLHRDVCCAVWDELVEAIPPVDFTVAMNAAGWAATLIISGRRACIRDKSALRKLWSATGAIRTRRLDAVIKATREPHSLIKTNSDSFGKFVEAELNGLAVHFGTELSEQLAKEVKKVRRLFSYYGNGGSNATSNPVRLGEASGLLFVDPVSDSVVASTAGFNAIYIQPFSARLGIGLESWDRIILELGETDSKFVEALASSVVVNCWPVEDVDSNIDPVNFGERTKANQQRVLGQRLQNRNDPGFSSRDILELRTPIDSETRFAVRVGTAIYRDDLTDMDDLSMLDSEQNPPSRLFVWSFTDVTKLVKSGMFSKLGIGPRQDEHRPQLATAGRGADSGKNET